MRIEEWRQFLESQFIEEGKEKAKPVEPALDKTEPSVKEASNKAVVSPSSQRVSDFVGLRASESVSSVSDSPPPLSQPPTHSEKILAPSTAQSEPGATSSSPQSDREKSPQPAATTIRPSADRMAAGSSTVAISVPNFVEFVPLLRQEMGIEYDPNPVPLVSQPELKESPVPRLRRRKRPLNVKPGEVVSPEMEDVWASLPKHLRYLAEWYDDGVTQKYYKSEFKETREALIERLTDPVLSLEDTARLLGVCPTTVRRYTDRGWLQHFRTEGNQRRFRLSDIVQFLEDQSDRRSIRSRKSSQVKLDLEEKSES